jgi:hypothetical protein
VLEARQLGIGNAERERIAGCTALQQFRKWITRAATAEKASDLLS